MANKLHHYLFCYETETVGHVNLLVWCGFLVCDNLLCLSCSPNFKLLIAQLTSKTGRADKPQTRPLQELFWQPGVYPGLIWASCFVFFYNMWLGVVHGSQISPPREWLYISVCDYIMCCTSSSVFSSKYVHKYYLTIVPWSIVYSDVQVQTAKDLSFFIFDEIYGLTWTPHAEWRMSVMCV